MRISSEEFKEIKSKIKDYIESHREEIINTLCDLVKIPSISGEKNDEILDYVCDLFEKNGFKSQKYEDYAISTLVGKSENSIGLFAHADVVPPLGEWIVTEPFCPLIKDGALFGRGSSDDKGAVVIALYIMKMIKELNLPTKSTIVAFTGANEETSMQDIRNYLKTHTPPSASIVIDSGFPTHLGDKGILWLSCTLNKKLNTVYDLNGGDAINIILECASARVKYNPDLYESLLANGEISAQRQGDEIVIYAKGISAHGANPEGTKNGGGIILSALLGANGFDSEDKNSLSLICDLLTTHDASCVGLKSEDSVFGKTTLTNGMVWVKNNKLGFTLDMRYGKSLNKEKILNTIAPVFEKHQISYEVIKDGEPNAIDKDAQIVLSTMAEYREYTGNMSAEPRISAGGTYSRYLPNAIEVGMTLEHTNHNLPSGHGGCHQPDENISINGFLKALELVSRMVIRYDSDSV